MSAKRASKGTIANSQSHETVVPDQDPVPPPSLPEDLQRALSSAISLLQWSEMLHLAYVSVGNLPPTWPIAAQNLVSHFAEHRRHIRAVLIELDAVGDWTEISDVSARPAHLAAVKFAEIAIERFYMAVLISIGSEQTVAMPQNAEGQVTFPADVDARLAHLRTFGDDVYSPERTESVQQYFATASPIRPPQRSRFAEQLDREARLAEVKRVESHRANSLRPDFNILNNSKAPIADSEPPATASFRWDKGSRTLFDGDAVVFKFKKFAPFAQDILDIFEAAGWPERILFQNVNRQKAVRTLQDKSTGTTIAFSIAGGYVMHRRLNVDPKHP
jgi:hypothetical protein